MHHIPMVGVPEKEESGQVVENLFEEIKGKIFPNVVKEKVTQVQ